MVRNIPKYTMSGGEEWHASHGYERIGVAKIRREVLRPTLDGRDPYEEAFNALDLQRNPRYTVVDAGCGDGDDELYLRIERGHLGPLIGVEPPPVDLTLAGTQNDNRFYQANSLIERNNIDNIRYLYGYLQALPLPDEFADRTMALWSIFAVPPEEQATALAELSRVTRPGGRIAIGTNAIGHTTKKHAIISQAGEMLGVKAPEPLSGVFKYEQVPQIVQEHTELMHIPQLDVYQDSQLALTAANLGDFMLLIHSYKDFCDPVPPAADWIEAVEATDQYQEIVKDIDTTGMALEAVKRGVRIFAKPRQ